MEPNEYLLPPKGESICGLLVKLRRDMGIEVPCEPWPIRLKRLADEVTDELPAELFRELNGGVVITDRAKTHSASDERRPLYILGEYSCSSSMGRYIILYGGSIKRVYGSLSDELLKTKLRELVQHELTHHIESLSGVRDLEIVDELRLEQYKSELAARDAAENAVQNGKNK